MLDLLDRLEGVRESGAGWTARCPAHADRRASLAVGRGDDGRWLLKCHAGCAFGAVVGALGIDARDLFPSNGHRHPPARREAAVYDYDGVFEVVRYEPKDFRQRRPDGRGGYLWNLDGITPRLYRLNDLAGRDAVVVVEGEKDVDRLWSLDLPATCNAGGAGQWRSTHAEQLKVAGVRSVVVVPDADDAGRRHGQAVARACAAAGLRARIAALPDGPKDICAYLDDGHDKRELAEVIAAAESYDGAADLPAGVVRLSDADVEGTAAEGPPAVARLIAHAGRVTLLHAREKAGKSTLIGAAVAAVTRGRSFLGMPTVAGDVLWVGEEAASDVKARLFQWDADLERVYFVGRPSRDPEHEASLRRLVERLRPVWVVIDTWSHYLQVHRVKDTAGPGEQGLLIGEVVSLARESGSAFAVSHHNRKNPSASAESGDAEGEYRDSTAIGAAVDMIVSLSRAKMPRARRLTPSGRWPEEPLTVVLEPGVGYELAPDLEEDEQARADGKPPARPLPERALLHLLRCDPLARPHASTLAEALDCSGRRYQDLRAALDALLDDGLVDHAQRPGATKQRDRGYALTAKGRERAEALRDQSISAISTKGNGAETLGNTPGNPTRFPFPRFPPQGVGGNGNGNRTA